MYLFNLTIVMSDLLSHFAENCNITLILSFVVVEAIVSYICVSPVRLFIIYMCFLCLLCFHRCFFSINPERGTKVERTNAKRLHVNARVLTLIQDLSDHEWRSI